MDEPATPSTPADDPPTPREHRSIAGTLLFVGALGVTGAAAWLYLRRQQKRADAQTRDRLSPRP